MSRKELGKVKSVKLAREGHGILTCFVTLDFGGTEQGFGGVALDVYEKVAKIRKGTAAGMDWIVRLLRLFDADSLDSIVGKTVWAIYKKQGWNEPIIGLETPEFDGGRTFMTADWQKEWFKE